MPQAPQAAPLPADLRPRRVGARHLRRGTSAPIARDPRWILNPRPYRNSGIDNGIEARLARTLPPIGGLGRPGAPGTTAASGPTRQHDVRREREARP